MDGWMDGWQLAVAREAEERAINKPETTPMLSATLQNFCTATVLPAAPEMRGSGLIISGNDVLPHTVDDASDCDVMTATGLLPRAAEIVHVYASRLVATC
eukprot:gene1965-5049_t